MLAERGLEVSYEAIRRWVLKFGSAIAANLGRGRPRFSDHWHLDETVIVIQRKPYWLWRAVDNEDEVLDFLFQSRRNAKAAKKLMKKLMKKLVKKHGFAPTRIVTDKPRSYPSAFQAIGLAAQYDRGLRANNRAENSHQPVRRRERKQQRFKSLGLAQRFLNIRSATYNTFQHRRHFLKRPMCKQLRSTSFDVWRHAGAAA